MDFPISSLLVSIITLLIKIISDFNDSSFLIRTKNKNFTHWQHFKMRNRLESPVFIDENITRDRIRLQIFYFAFLKNLLGTIVWLNASFLISISSYFLLQISACQLLRPWRVYSRDAYSLKILNIFACFYKILVNDSSFKQTFRWKIIELLSCYGLRSVWKSSINSHIYWW